jgi:hypothetical protein
MTKRAILWCGQVRRPSYRTYVKGRRHDTDDPLAPTDDFTIQANGLELAFEAACRLGVSPRDIHACLVDDALKPQKLQTQRRRATVADLQHLLKVIAAHAKPGDPLLFVAVNHGAKDGLVVTPEDMDEFSDDDSTTTLLTPEMLDEFFRPLVGPQVIINTACHAGAFLRLAREGRAVLASCSEEEVYWISRHDKWSAFLDELFGAWCKCALSDAVPRAQLSLDEAFSRAEERLTSAGARTKPLRAGAAAWPR